MTAQATRKATRKAPRAPGQIRSLLRAVHPRQALAFAVVVGTLVALTGRPGREIALSAVAVLVAQLIMGLLNDLLDLDRDRMGGAKNKPIAEGIDPAGQRQLRDRRTPAPRDPALAAERHPGRALRCWPR